MTTQQLAKEYNSGMLNSIGTMDAEMIWSKIASVEDVYEKANQWLFEDVLEMETTYTNGKLTEIKLVVTVGGPYTFITLDGSDKVTVTTSWDETVSEAEYLPEFASYMWQTIEELESARRA